MRDKLYTGELDFRKYFSLVHSFSCLKFWCAFILVRDGKERKKEGQPQINRERERYIKKEGKGRKREREWDKSPKEKSSENLSTRIYECWKCSELTFLEALQKNSHHIHRHFVFILALGHGWIPVHMALVTTQWLPTVVKSMYMAIKTKWAYYKLISRLVNKS